MTAPNADLAQIQPRRSPHIDRTIDNTALAAYMRCPREYLYGYVLHRRKRGTTPALSFGTTWHAIMQAHYETGGNADAVTRAAIMSWEPHNNPDDHRTVERALSSYDAYIRRWGDHTAEVKGWGSTVGFPETPVVEKPAEIWWPGALHPYTGKIDRVVEHNGLYIVEDHKTTSALGASFFKQFDPSNQMMGYAWLAQKLTGLPISGVRINAFGVLKTQNKFERQTVMFSEARLNEWAENYNVWIRRIEDAMLWLKVGRGEGIQESPGVPEDQARLLAFPHNFNACAGKYGMCQYVDVCTSPARVRQRILESDYEFAPWDPMQPDGDEVSE